MSDNSLEQNIERMMSKQDIYIDWSKAPQGTTHAFVYSPLDWCNGSPSSHTHWEKWEGGVVYEWNECSWIYCDIVNEVDHSARIKKPEGAGMNTNSLEQNIERVQKELDEMKAKLKAENESSKKPVDLSVVIRSGIDCEFGEAMTEAPATVVGALESIYPDVSRSYKKLNGGWWSYCAPRMAYWHPWRGGDCPLPDGLKTEMEFRSGAAATTTAPSDLQWDHIKSGGDIIAFRVIGLEEGYCWPWEI